MQNSRLYFAVVLLPLSLAYGIVIFLRNLFFDIGLLKSRRFNLPVISVGNITVGGTGKTPHVEYLVNQLKSECRIAVLSRGYKRGSKGFLLAGPESTAEEIGDESRQIKNRFPDVIVAVDNSRVHGIEQLMAEFPDLGAVILDDAFQHRYVCPGLSIVLVDYERPIFRDFLLPLGNLRESRCRINRADMVIITKCPTDMNDLQRREFIRKLQLQHQQPVFFTCYHYGILLPVVEGEAPPVDLHEERKDNPAVLMVTGIANSKPLKVYLDKNTTSLTEMHFPDHHFYNAADIHAIEQRFMELPADKKIIITTEKDAAKLKELSGEFQKTLTSLYYIPIEVQFLFDGGKPFDEIATNFYRKG